MTDTAEPTARPAVMGDNAESQGIRAMVIEDPRALYRDPKVLPKLLAEIDRDIDNATNDVTTDKGRKAIASEAHDFRKLKALLEKTGMEMTEEWRKQTKEVNDIKREVKDELELRYEKRRAPVTAWEEAEKAREESVRLYRELLENSRRVPAGMTPERILKQREKVEAVTVDEAAFGDLTEKVLEEREDALKALDAAHAAALQDISDKVELARLRQEAETRRLADEARAREEQRAEEQRQAAEEAERQRLEAVEQARIEAEERVRREAEAAEAAREEQRQAAEAEMRRKAQAEVDAANARADEAEKARLAVQAAAEEAELARKAVERQMEEDRERMRRDEELRRKDQEHRERVFAAIAEDIVAVSSISQAKAHAIAQAIAAGSIRNVKVEF